MLLTTFIIKRENAEFLFISSQQSETIKLYDFKKEKYCYQWKKN